MATSTKAVSQCRFQMISIIEIDIVEHPHKECLYEAVKLRSQPHI